MAESPFENAEYEKVQRLPRFLELDLDPLTRKRWTHAFKNRMRRPPNIALLAETGPSAHDLLLE